MNYDYGYDVNPEHIEPDDPDLDILLAEAESADDLPAEHQVSVGPPLTPSQIRSAELLGEIENSAWLWSDGTRTELRRCPQSLERVARSRARELQRGGKTDD